MKKSLYSARLLLAGSIAMIFINYGAITGYAEMPKATVNIVQWCCLSGGELESVNDYMEIIHGQEDVSERYFYENDIPALMREISIVENRKSYTQKEAVAYIRKLINRGSIPKYILTSGKYTYKENINAVVPNQNFFDDDLLNLRSQPNAQSRIITKLGAVYTGDSAYIDVASYIGEWTNPKGTCWVAVEYNGTIGWLHSKYVRLVTDKEILLFAEKIKKLLSY